MGFLVAAGVAMAIVAAAGSVLWERTAISALPEPPRAARQPAAIRAHLQDAYDAARRSPRDVSAVGGYCIALHADMFYAVAEECYGRTVELSDAWEWVYLRSLIRGDLGGGAGLLQDLQTVVEREPGFSPAWLRLGDAEFKARRYDEAERAWREASRLPEPARYPSDAPRHRVEIPVAMYAALGLARVRLARNDLEEAADIVERAMTGGPPFGPAWRLRAEIDTSRGRAADAVRALARARRLPPFAPYADPMVDRLVLESRNSTFLLRIASEADLAVNGPWSEYLTRRALEFDPDNPEVIVKLGRVLRTLGRNDEALVYFRRYEGLVPDDPQILAHLGGALSELGRFAEAEPLLRRAAATLDDSISHYNLALLLARTERLDEAVVEYERALERDPADSRTRGNLAAALARQGNLDRAAHELTRLLEMDPEDPVAHVNLGLVFAQRGETMRARRAFEEALRLDANLTPARNALASLPGT